MIAGIDRHKSIGDMVKSKVYFASCKDIGFVRFDGA